MTTIHNYTPHPIRLCDDHDRILRTYHPAGCARITFSPPDITYVPADGLNVPIADARIPTGITGLPGPEPDTLLIVSTLILTALPSRDDLIAPDNLVRDSKGRVIGCRRFAR